MNANVIKQFIIEMIMIFNIKLFILYLFIWNILLNIDINFLKVFDFKLVLSIVRNPRILLKSKNISTHI